MENSRAEDLSGAEDGQNLIFRRNCAVSNEFENRSTHMIHETGQVGSVEIADEVVAIIAGLAATEVDGVASMAGNITNELVGKLGMKNLSKGVKVAVMDTSVSVDLSLQ